MNKLPGAGSMGKPEIDNERFLNREKSHRTRKTIPHHLDCRLQFFTALLVFFCVLLCVT